MHRIGHLVFAHRISLLGQYLRKQAGLGPNQSSNRRQEFS